MATEGLLGGGSSTRERQDLGRLEDRGPLCGLSRTVVKAIGGVALLLVVFHLLQRTELFSRPDPSLAASLRHDAVDSVLEPDVEGGRWAQELHRAVQPGCLTNITTVPYKGNRRAVFASVPRSGNSYLRTLVERVTGYRTNSVYCDKSLAPTFLGECAADKTFFIKTHFPCKPNRIPADWEDYYKPYDSTVHMVRNPLDSIASWWHLANAPKVEHHLDHEAKVEVGKFGEEHRLDMIHYARRWRDHALYWEQAPIPRWFMRFEDFRASPVPSMMDLLNFILPEEEKPSIEELACMVEPNDGHAAYHSRKSSDFASWDLWEPGLRRQVLHITRRVFCKYGYLTLLHDRLGPLEEMEGFCDDIDHEPATDPFHEYGQKFVTKHEYGFAQD